MTRKLHGSFLPSHCPSLSWLFQPETASGMKGCEAVIRGKSPALYTILTLFFWKDKLKKKVVLKPHRPWMTFAPWKCDTLSSYGKREYKRLPLHDREIEKHAGDHASWVVKEGDPKSEAGTGVDPTDSGWIWTLLLPLCGALIKSLQFTCTTGIIKVLPLPEKITWLWKSTWHKPGNSDIPFAIPVSVFNVRWNTGCFSSPYNPPKLNLKEWPSLKSYFISQ